jgi:long-subunit acyl-CoA synthetase (AMP-forming)
MYACVYRLIVTDALSVAANCTDAFQCVHVYVCAGYGQTAELHAFMAHGAALGIAESVDKLLVNLGEVKPTVLFSVPVLFKKVYDGIHAKVSVFGSITITIAITTVTASHSLCSTC